MKYLKYIITLLSIIVIDQVTKFFAFKHLINAFKEIKITPFLNFTLEFNRGICWSFFNVNNKAIFITITAIICLVIIIFSLQTYLQYKQNIPILAEIFVIGGGLSNVIDRFVYKAVVDFIELHIGQWNWPIFNIADMCIVVGIMCIIIKNVVKKDV
jgi:signal peptidase II